MLLCLGAAFCVLVEPAAASSGIPGLLAYLNGVTPKAGKSFITGKRHRLSFLPNNGCKAGWYDLFDSIRTLYWPRRADYSYISFVGKMGWESAARS